MSDTTMRAKALLEGITPGKWVVNHEDWAVISSGSDSVIHGYVDTECDDCGAEVKGDADVAISIEDAEFIAAAPSLIRELVTENEQLRAEVERLRRFAAFVELFITERAGYITALENCAPDNTADYWRWQGHAESRRQLLASLPWPPDTDDAERISKLARVTR